MKKIIIICVFVGVFLQSCSIGSKQFSDIKILMGTTVEIKVWSNNERTAKKNIQDAFAEIARIESIFSVYQPSSEISKLNKNGSSIVSDDVIQLIKKSIYFSEISDGAFDITVLPVIEMWSRSKKSGKIPNSDEIKKLLLLVGSKNILIDNNNKKISFSKKGMKIDLGGIAKGYAVDRAVEMLINGGIKTGMVNAGGDVRCFGSKMYKIALQNPRDKNNYISILKIKNKAITTSGDYERYFFIDKKKISHIINPSTGYPADESISSTIITDTATDADALSTAIFVLGHTKGIELVKKYKNADCLIIDKERHIYKSAGFAKYE